MKVESVSARHVMSDHRFVYMHCALGFAGSSASEVEQREVSGVGMRDVEVVASFVHQPLEIERAWYRLNLLGCANQKNVPSDRGAMTQLRNLSFVEGGCSHQHSTIADSHPLADRFRTKR